MASGAPTTFQAPVTDRGADRGEALHHEM